MYTIDVHNRCTQTAVYIRRHAPRAAAPIDSAAWTSTSNDNLTSTWTEMRVKVTGQTKASALQCGGLCLGYFNWTSIAERRNGNRVLCSRQLKLFQSG
jgi:hypothetical protein